MTDRIVECPQCHAIRAICPDDPEPIICPSCSASFSRADGVAPAPALPSAPRPAGPSKNQIAYRTLLILTVAVGAIVLYNQAGERSRQDTTITEAERRRDAVLAARCQGLGNTSIDLSSASKTYLDHMLGEQGKPIVNPTENETAFSWLDGVVIARFFEAISLRSGSPVEITLSVTEHLRRQLSDFHQDGTTKSSGAADICDISVGAFRPGVSPSDFGAREGSIELGTQTGQLTNGWRVFWHVAASGIVDRLTFRNPDIERTWHLVKPGETRR